MSRLTTGQMMEWAAYFELQAEAQKGVTKKQGGGGEATHWRDQKALFMAFARRRNAEA